MGQAGERTWLGVAIDVTCNATETGQLPELVATVVVAKILCCNNISTILLLNFQILFLGLCAEVRRVEHTCTHSGLSTRKREKK